MPETSEVKQLVNVGIVAAFATLAFIGTLVIRIPIPATGGYFNLGDTFVMIAALLYGPLIGGLVGLIGPAMADAVGYPQTVRPLAERPIGHSLRPENKCLAVGIPPDIHVHKLSDPHATPPFDSLNKRQIWQIAQIIRCQTLIKKMRSVEYKQIWEASKNELMGDLIKNRTNFVVASIQTVPLTGEYW